MLRGIFARSGCDIRFEDSGGADPGVVLLHGAGADHVMFEDQARALAEAGHRVVLLDLRGHGQSRPNAMPLSAGLFVDDIEAMTAHLGLVRPVVAGHSLGGNIAQALVRRGPDRYRGLVVMDSTWSTGPVTPAGRFMLRIAAPSLALIPARVMPRVMAHASAVTASARSDAVRAFSQLSKAEFLDVWRATVAFIDPDPGYRTPVPLLLIRGEADATGNISSAMPAWASAEGVTELVVPAAGHLVTQDAPTAVSEALLGFIDSIGKTR